MGHYSEISNLFTAIKSIRQTVSAYFNSDEATVEQHDSQWKAFENFKAEIWQDANNIYQIGYFLISNVNKRGISPQESTESGQEIKEYLEMMKRTLDAGNPYSELVRETSEAVDSALALVSTQYHPAMIAGPNGKQPASPAQTFAPDTITGTPPNGPNPYNISLDQRGIAPKAPETPVVPESGAAFRKLQSRVDVFQKFSQQAQPSQEAALKQLCLSHAAELRSVIRRIGFNNELGWIADSLQKAGSSVVGNGMRGNTNS